MTKLMIAVKSEALAAELSEALTEYALCICHTGAQALDALETQRPEILILDLSLPWGSGLTVLQEAAYKPPVILGLTNLLGNSVLRTAAAAGAQELLLLPCSVPQIIRHLEALTQKRPAPEV